MSWGRSLGPWRCVWFGDAVVVHTAVACQPESSPTARVKPTAEAEWCRCADLARTAAQLSGVLCARRPSDELSSII